MGLEDALRDEVRATKLRLAILSAVKVSGLLIATAAAPKAVATLLSYTGRSDERYRSAVSRLKEKGLLSIEDGCIILTAKGEWFLDSHTSPIRKPRRWDHKWRVVIFDIPESRKTKRNLLRQKLLDTGFLKLQNSVWVFPYDCEDLITLLKADHHLGKEVLYMIVDKIERDHWIKAHFSIT